MDVPRSFTGRGSEKPAIRSLVILKCRLIKLTSETGFVIYESNFSIIWVEAALETEVIN